MANQQHPITPPPELVQQWLKERTFLESQPLAHTYLATRAAQWGADQELLACGNYLKQCAAWEEEDVTEFYNYRRPRPPSLKELALEELEHVPVDPEGGMTYSGLDLIRRALEALDD
jgi:hypothetical protein